MPAPLVAGREQAHLPVDRREKGRMQLFSLSAGGLGEAEALPEIDGTIEEHAWSPDGSRILVRTAGMHADGAGRRLRRLGVGWGPAEWVPAVDSWEDRQVWRRLWVVDVASGEVRMLSREGLNVWEADWCGDDAVVAVASEDPGESAWYDSPLVLIDAATGADRVIATSDVQFGLPVGSLDGTRAAVVEAPCSDRQLVSVGRGRPRHGCAPWDRDRGRRSHVAGMAHERRPRVHDAPTGRHGVR